MTNPMQDKELMDDVLTSQKMMTSNYSIYANECAGQSLRTDMLNLLREEHEIQADLFYQMQSKGWYPTPPAEQQKINQTKQKFSQASM
ncbi:MAG: spore coat protein [Clostridiales bacterium]|nr:spore coat protein [Clostridiales bacterium]